MSISEVDKCYLCELIGDFDEFKDIKEKFDVQHECWKQQQNQDSKKVRTGLQKSFSQSGDLNRHINSVHNGQKDHKCDSCKLKLQNSKIWHKNFVKFHEIFVYL